jgi:hypothetical protein
MTTNRRNYYRILHVQPDAPLEIIKASYRSLMTKLRYHPDLGGDHETAVLINEAYAFLSNPDKRAAYDHFLSREIDGSFLKNRRSSAAQQGESRQPPVSEGERKAGDAKHDGYCNFCRAPLKIIAIANARCFQCDSPISPLYCDIKGVKEFFGKRSIPRVVKKAPITLYRKWGEQAISAQVHDLSPIGICIIADINVRIGQIVKIVATEFDAVAIVVARRLIGANYSIHARLLNAIYFNSSGVFVSMTA